MSADLEALTTQRVIVTWRVHHRLLSQPPVDSHNCTRQMLLIELAVPHSVVVNEKQCPEQLPDLFVVNNVMQVCAKHGYVCMVEYWTWGTPSYLVRHRMPRWPRREHRRSSCASCGSLAQRIMTRGGLLRVLDML